MNKYYLICILSFFSFSMLKAQVLYNKGALSVKGSTTALYIKGDIVVSGNECSIVQDGKTILTGDFVNNITNGNVFTGRNGIFEFGGSSVQRIRGTASKASNYIYFPNSVIINNTNTAYNRDSAVVILDPMMGATMKVLDLKQGRFVLDAKATGTRKTDIAHLMIEPGGKIEYFRTNNPATKNLDGIIQVNLAMGDNADEGHLVGFSSPFETLFADYFFFNFLSVPDNETFFAGNRDLWNTNPLMEIPAGHGYVLGQGIVPHSNNPADLANPSFYYNSHKNSAYSSAQYADVAKENFSFARLFAPASFTSFVTDNKRFTGEKLNITTVDVPIQEGFNYLGNPFTVPLDLTTFVTNPTSGTWGTFAAYEIEPAFYILTPGSKGEYLGNDLFSFTASYLVAQNIGSTADSKILAPMQMFAVKKRTSTPNTFKINASARTHGNTSFLRSEENAIIDELLIETEDQITGGFDRTCIVFRKNANLEATDTYDAEKLFNTTGGVNQIYTRSSDNKKLTTNIVPNTISSLTMYFEPSSTEQQVTLTADRLNSLQVINTVELEDTKTGKKTDLMQNPSYTFTSTPADHIERFILHFNTNAFSTEDIRSDSGLNAWYNNGTIYLNGLQDTDLGQPVSIYTTQGQLLYQQKITDITSYKLYKTLATGIYIVKIEGNQRVVKLSVK